MTNLRPLIATLLVSFAHAGSIEICVKARQSGVSTNLAGATVVCYDEDLDGDDRMTTTNSNDNQTGADGCITLSYSSKSSSFWNPCGGWDCPFYTNPDIYCKVTKTGYYPLYTNTKEDHNQSNRADFGTVTIYPERRCWKAKNFGGETCSKGERINKFSTTLEGCKEACELNSSCKFIYWQSDEQRPAHDEPLCHMYRSCNSKRTPASGGSNYQVDDCSGLTNGCGPKSDLDVFNELVDSVSGFADQCNNHDLCYNDCSETQDSCDDEFRAMMYSECNDVEDTENKDGCKSIALILYGLVQEFGADAFLGAQQDGGCI